MEGFVFNIQKFCVNDGPGIRTTVFFKGCPIRCVWCHNPESHRSRPELLFDSTRCTLCGRCVSACPKGAHSVTADGHILDRERCEACGACADVCYNGVLESAGKRMTADEVMREVLRDKMFYENSGGGMTLSGGEPLMQADFAYALLSLAKENGLHTCIETCGHVPTEAILRAAPLTDIFLYDCKLTDSEQHKRYTGVSSELIEKNLLTLDGAGAKSILRCPIIPDINDTEEHFAAIAARANSLQNVLGIELEPYHALGGGKYERLGKDGSKSLFRMPEPDEVASWIEAIAAKTAVSVKKA